MDYKLTKNSNKTYVKTREKILRTPDDIVSDEFQPKDPTLYKSVLLGG
jgi:hypothetical protein